MKKEVIINKIIEKIKSNYNGLLVCEYQRADLFVAIDGQDETIESIDTERIYFEDDYHSVDFVNADMHILLYIDSVIN